jgi:hypothetical protein
LTFISEYQKLQGGPAALITGGSPWRSQDGRMSSARRLRRHDLRQGGIMQHSPQDMQRSVLISQSGFGVVNECSRASSRDDQPENRDALGASSRRRLLGERGAAQNPIREMKVAEPVDVELLQAERLKDLFILHRCVPSRSEYQSGHNYRMSYRNLFLRLVVKSLLRVQRKINRWNVAGAPASSDNLASSPPPQVSRAQRRPEFDERELGAIFVVLAALVLPVIADCAAVSGRYGASTPRAEAHAHEKQGKGN